MSYIKFYIGTKKKIQRKVNSNDGKYGRTQEEAFNILGVPKYFWKINLPVLSSSSTLIHLGPGGMADGFCTDEAGNACKLIPGWNGPPGWVGITKGCCGAPEIPTHCTGYPGPPTALYWQTWGILYDDNSPGNEGSGSPCGKEVGTTPRIWDREDIHVGV